MSLRGPRPWPEPRTAPKRGEWLLVDDGDDGRLFFVFNNVLKRGTTIKCTARMGPAPLTLLHAVIDDGGSALVRIN